MVQKKMVLYSQSVTHIVARHAISNFNRVLVELKKL